MWQRVPQYARVARVLGRSSILRPGCVQLVDVLAQTADVDNVLWPRDELAVGFHHRLVVINASGNSNGRYSRLAAESARELWEYLTCSNACSNAIDFAGVRDGSPATPQASDLPESDTSEHWRTARRSFTRKRSGVRIPHRPPKKPQVIGTIVALPSVAPKAECSNACSNVVWIRVPFVGVRVMPQARELRQRETRRRHWTMRRTPNRH